MVDAQDREERQSYLDAMVERRGQVGDFHKVIVAEDLPFARALNGLLDVAYASSRSLDMKTKELVFLGALIGLGAGKEHVKVHVEAAKRAGATKREVLEAIELLLGPCGYPKFMVGYEAWTEAFPVERLEPSPRP